MTKRVENPTARFWVWFGLALALAGLGVGLARSQTASLLPNGKQQYADANGVPLANGTVCYYIPNTLTPKTTWLDPLQISPNTSPCVTLDAAGRAIVYGSGQYRQRVIDQFGGLVWDQLTDDLISLGTGASGAGGPFFAFPGSTVGSANAQVVTSTLPTGYAVTVGNQVNFVAGFTNTGAVTLNVAGTGVFSVVKRTSGGLVALAAGDLVLGEAYAVSWDGTEYQLLNSGWQSGFATIASAGTTAICAAGQRYLQVTGTTTITAFDSGCPAGTQVTLEFAGVLTLTQSASLLLPANGANITTAAGSTAIAVAEGSNVWRVVVYQNANGNSLTGAAGGDLSGTFPNPAVATFQTGQSIWATGNIRMTMAPTASVGWVLMNDGTIGDASSGASTRANADTSALFALLWNNCANANCPVGGGRGGSAGADFAAHKAIALPLVLGRAMASAGVGAGLSGRPLGSASGAETTVITQGNLPAVNWNVTDPGHRHLLLTGTYDGANSFGQVAFSANGTQAQTNTAAAVTTTGITVSSGGSGVAISILQPTSFVNLEIKL